MSSSRFPTDDPKSGRRGFGGSRAQLSGLNPPESAWISTDPSSLRISRRVDSGRNADRRPVYVTSHRATMRRTERHPSVRFGQSFAWLRNALRTARRPTVQAKESATRRIGIRRRAQHPHRRRRQHGATSRASRSGRPRGRSGCARLVQGRRDVRAFQRTSVQTPGERRFPLVPPGSLPRLVPRPGEHRQREPELPRRDDPGVRRRGAHPLARCRRQPALFGTRANRRRGPKRCLTRIGVRHPVRSRPGRVLRWCFGKRPRTCLGDCPRQRGWTSPPS